MGRVENRRDECATPARAPASLAVRSRLLGPGRGTAAQMTLPRGDRRPRSSRPAHSASWNRSARCERSSTTSGRGFPGRDVAAPSSCRCWRFRLRSAASARAGPPSLVVDVDPLHAPARGVEAAGERAAWPHRHLEQYPALSLSTAGERAAARRILSAVRREARRWTTLHSARRAGFETRVARRRAGDESAHYLHAERLRERRTGPAFDAKRPRRSSSPASRAARPCSSGSCTACSEASAGRRPAGR